MSGDDPFGLQALFKLNLAVSMANAQAYIDREEAKHRELVAQFERQCEEAAELNRMDPRVIDGECTVVEPRPRLEHKP